MQPSFPLVRNRVPKALRGREPFKSSDEAREVLLGIRCKKSTLEVIKLSLSYLIKERPVEVYAIVLELLRAPPRSLPKKVVKGLKEIAGLAARNSLLDYPLGSWTIGMNIEQEDYRRFTTYRRQCSVRLVQLLEMRNMAENMGTHWIWYNTRCGVCSRTSNSVAVSGTVLGAAKYPVVWWVTYWERVVASVADFPCEKPFEDEHMWNSTLQALARECPTCYEAAAREFPQFRGKLVEAITKLIDNVRTSFVDRCICREANFAYDRSS